MNTRTRLARLALFAVGVIGNADDSAAGLVGVGDFGDLENVGGGAAARQHRDRVGHGAELVGDRHADGATADVEAEDARRVQARIGGVSGLGHALGFSTTQPVEQRRRVAGEADTSAERERAIARTVTHGQAGEKRQMAEVLDDDLGGGHAVIVVALDQISEENAAHTPSRAPEFFSCVSARSSR